MVQVFRNFLVLHSMIAERSKKSCNNKQLQKKIRHRWFCNCAIFLLANLPKRFWVTVCPLQTDIPYDQSTLFIGSPFSADIIPVDSG